MKTNSLLFLFSTLLCLNTSLLSAQWEPTDFTASTWVLAQAENGNLIAADDIYPDFGGLYLSQDAGDTWTKTNAADYAYTAHLVNGESIYMGGVDSNVAISHDNGASWTNVSFKSLMPEASENSPIYAMEYHNGRVYASVLDIGIVYTEDEGATWTLTDQESLYDINNPENGGQWTYNLRSYNNKLYNSGAFGIWEYDEAADVWSQVDDTWYAGSSLIVDDVFYAIYNAAGIPAGIRYTTDFQNWEVMPLPNGVGTTIRFMEYYEGAFFMGHVNDAIFYSLNQGITWVDYREDFPAFVPVPGVNLYSTPMNLVFDGDTMFCGVFSPSEGLRGVYKAPVPAAVLSVKETATVLQPVVYPNPAKDFVILQLPNSHGNQGSLVIRDVLGRVKYENTHANEKGNSIKISTKEWSSGLYFYSIVTEEGKASGKFLVE